MSIYETGDINEKPVVSDNVTDSEQMAVNEHIKGLKGREYQGLLRIVRDYNKEKITREQATQMLMSGYGISQEECIAWLGEEII